MARSIWAVEACLAFSGMQLKAALAVLRTGRQSRVGKIPGYRPKPLCALSHVDLLLAS